MKLMEKQRSLKPLKWWLLALIALCWALWASSAVTPVYASSDMNAQGHSTFRIGGDLIVAGPGPVEDAFTIGGNLVISPGTVVQGDAFAIGGSLTLDKNVKIRGDAFTVGGVLIQDETAIVEGDLFTVMEPFSGLFSRFGVIGTLYLGHVTFWAISFAVASITGLVLLTLLPDHVSTVTDAIYGRPLASLLYGLGGIVALGMIAVLLSGSVLGALLIPVANLAALLTGLFGGTAVAVWLGERLYRQHLEAIFQHFWLGILVLFLISLLPLIDSIIIGLLVLFGFGATLLARYGSQLTSRLPDSPSPTEPTLDRLQHQPES